MREAVVEVYPALQDTRECGHSCVSVGAIAKLIMCPRGVPCLHVRRYTLDPAHVVDCGEPSIDADGTFEKGPMCILDSRDQVLRHKTVRLVKVLW